MLRLVVLIISLLVTISDARRRNRFPGQPQDDDNNTLQMTHFRENIVQVGDKTTYFREKCVNEVCTTCIDNDCFNSSGYGLIKITENCPLAACMKNCTGFVMDNDHCPTCKCNGFATREPCSNDSECPSKICTNSLCTYPAVSNDLAQYCDFAFDCPANQECVDSSCVSSNKEHLENITCVFDFMCPTNYSCTNMTCWNTGADHLFGGQCIFNRMCPLGYKCHKMTCYRKTDNNNGSICISDFDCAKDQTCMESMCKNATGRIPMHQGGGRIPLFGRGGGNNEEENDFQPFEQNNQFYNN